MVKRAQNPRVCHGHTRPIVELSYRHVARSLLCPPDLRRVRLHLDRLIELD